MEGIYQREHLSGVPHKPHAHLGNLSPGLHHQMSICLCQSPNPCRSPAFLGEPCQVKAGHEQLEAVARVPGVYDGGDGSGT